MLQQLWLAKTNWDDQLSEALSGWWGSFTSKIECLSTIKIPRFKGPPENATLIGISDASERGYAAVIYIVSNLNGISTTSLLAAKTKVTPLKLLSIPHLELCGALLLAKLFSPSELQLADLNIR